MRKFKRFHKSLPASVLHVVQEKAVFLKNSGDIYKISPGKVEKVKSAEVLLSTKNLKNERNEREVSTWIG